MSTLMVCSWMAECQEDIVVIGTISWAWVVESIRDWHDPVGLGRGKLQQVCDKRFRDRGVRLRDRVGIVGIVWDRVGIVAIPHHLPGMDGGKLQVWARSRGLGSWKASGIGTIPWLWVVGSFRTRHDPVALDRGKLHGSARSQCSSTR